MIYESVDNLQKLLVKDVFHYAKDAKKAAGRALGTLVEVITFYLLKSWGFGDSIAIERSLAEYGNPEIAHNVEYSIHPISRYQDLLIENYVLPLTCRRIFNALMEPELNYSLHGFELAKNVLMTVNGVLRNSCVIGKGERSNLVATLDGIDQRSMRLHIVEQFSKPYAMFECKRVGVEEGMKKGPQTIEKSKTGGVCRKIRLIAA